MEFNSNLFKIEGYIGRRDFIFNYFHIGAISLPFFLPYSVWLLIEIFKLSNINLFSYNYFASAPIFVKIFTFIGIFIYVPLSIINITKRANDIFEKVNIPFIVFASVFCVLSSLYGFFTYKIFHLGALIFFLFLLFLMIKEGKISNKLPFDYKKEFNWGAFMGTWMWGIYNKSYIPLWNLLLWISPWGFYFSVVCGMMGNEWAYKNKKWNNVDKFRESQKKQTVFWIIANAIGIPFLIVSFAICIGLLGASYFIKNPEALDNMTKIVEQYDNKLFNQIFTSYEIKEEENAFYVIDSVWKNADMESKINFLDVASDKAADIKNGKEKADGNNKDDNKKTYSKETELTKTKIYSSINKNKLLGEYVYDNSADDIKSIIKTAMKAYRFY